MKSDTCENEASCEKNRCSKIVSRKKWLRGSEKVVSSKSSCSTVVCVTTN